ncbi:hypothetical protein AVI51_05465 [Piscirickettsia salmonis]|uniref:Uncharacterized protein n=1 Tax=Piscirickettsia salmonis TaxID=1238 RepID=A0A9Q6LSC4_PISSA|nr:hypothetical protein [Piscirickettsia salmonis]ALA25534.1 transposase [Piscirickettsia salmonis]APS43044.1 hypothetical protein AVI48_00685 [Piscirickettsia salmonis]APS46392.1 hypothetical protein AVI49_01280 [Piscirickettsia salmonis]APS50362.1 hypothetical protein AVI50_05530 [Piscirickettsia salmonis]APS53561.1 hypothetical protein AVI51_05465 [Piscirickettsia salmonis]
MRALRDIKKDKGINQALDRSCGGFSTKVHILTEGLGYPVDFVLTRGQAHDAPQAQGLLTSVARKRRYLGRYFAHPMMQNRRAKRDDYKPSAVRVTQRYVP